jgi:polyisoprenoid-binding protein YceI
MMFTPRALLAVALALVLTGGCGRKEPSDPSTSSTSPTGDRASGAAAGPPIAGRHTFVIVPEQSKASYHAREEFFPGAFRRIGIEAGKLEAVGSTQKIEGTFQLDPEHLDESPGENSFTVQLTTLTSNQDRRDNYIREIRDDGGPSFDAYPTATFKGTSINGTSRPNDAGRALDFKLAGDFTVREITKPIVFDVKAQLSGDTLTGTATTRILLSDYEIGPIDFYDTVKVADDVAIEVQFTGRAR